MPITKLSKKGFWTDLKTGSSGWGPNRNYNSTRMEQIISTSILGQVATSGALPAAPSDGDTYYVQDTTFLAMWVVYSGQPGQWFQDFTPTGLPVYDETLDQWFYFNGTALAPWPGGGVGVTSISGFWVDNTNPSTPIITAPKMSINAVAPTVTDDDTQDYSVNSLWYNETLGTMWVCKDATTGAAVWQPLSNTHIDTVAPAVTDDDTAGYYVSALWYNSTNGGFYICQDATTGAAIWSLINGSSIANYAVSGSSGGTISPALGTGPVTNFSIAGFITSGRPVEIRVIPDGGANPSMFGNQNTGASDMEFDVIFKRDGVEFARQNFRIAGENPAGTDLASYPGPGAIFALDEPAAGTYTYSIELEAISATTGGRILRSRMYIREV